MASAGGGEEEALEELHGGRCVRIQIARLYRASSHRTRTWKFLRKPDANVTGTSASGIPWLDHFDNSDSIALVIAGSFGAKSGAKRATTSPLRLIRNFSKFHMISVSFLGPRPC
jgi:hypothetical protein